ncbi:MAG: aminotransferase class V-fold PLP-dependent enzyme [Chloroflexi bacterium]|nr:aminotransferase class V-fold PLP-dependent enzyme [Chloroflexota bacterium]
MIYLDHAATSWPKPPAVLRAMSDYLETAGGNPGRSGHRLSIAAARYVYDAREAVASLFHAPDPLRVIFTLNVTYALNLAMRGLLQPGDHAVTTSIEHNSVMRPLRELERQGVRLSVVAGRPDGTLDLDALRQAITRGTRLVVVNHASNVMGAILPVSEIAQIAHHVGALLLVDAAQTAGTLPIDVAAMEIDLLAFTGHKGLQGPPGTGGLIIGSNVDVAQLTPLARGGTGSRSEFEEQPEMLPDKYESGTPNGVGLAGLGAGVRWLVERTVESIRAHELELATVLTSGLRCIKDVTVYGPVDPKQSVAVVSCRVKGQRVSTIGLRLDDEFEILCRVGLHCAPAAHRTIGTFPEGTIRLAPGVFTTMDDIYATIRAFEKLACL